ncbi:Hypothetical protein NTJ_03860 [Nesidiocoris tenuis]|uniref:Dynein heavy chain region D6 P-loop domain-containing protein n=1 Tax=Nesidiocoris tenuis TaxID=355587 RepID=A0ABN7AIE4_9HEMI|nr:Hypothetical protein NTJ_03860 [Nesidiocoris tenuis]
MEDGSMIVQIGSEQIPCNPNFRLYIIISCFQDTLDPTVYTSATIIDCTLGEAIEEKSSQIAMTCFDPAIGAEQRELQLHRFRISGNLRSLQEITLQKLHEYQGNIFDDFLFIQELTKLRNESEHQWGMVESLAISFPSQFESMIDDISANGEEWKKWLQGKRENAWTLPGAIDQNFDSSFDKLLVIKSLRKDALLYSIQYFIKEVLGEVFLTPSTLRFEDIMHVTTCETPILVSVGRGSDPLPKLLALNKKIHQNPICDHISLGRGSEKLVLEKVSQSIQQGTWLIIQNCHVIPSFMYELHQTFCSFEHKNSTFRLWMTTEDVSVFLLQFVLSSHKIVIEEPTPVKISLLDTYESLDPEQFSSCVHPAFRSTVFALAFFHGVIEERKKFGKYGWNMDYNFTKTDLLVSITIIKQYLDKIFNEGNFRIPWDSLRYFIGEVVYGGRVTDDHDRRILNTYIHEYFGDFILESTKPFEFNRMGTICQYPLPPFGERQDYIDYIRSLPLLTEPSVFGVHDKRQHDVEIDEAEDVCQKLAIISNRLIGDSEFNSLGRQNDEILTIISSIESKIPDTFQYEKLKMSIGSDPQPMMLCLIRELKTFNQLIATMKSSLDGVRKVVTGLSVTTNEISEVRDQLMSHSPPRLWTKFVPECDQNVGKWLLTLGRRSNQFEKWVTRGEPWILWLAGLAYPQAYLTAIAQVACREEGWPMDAVAFHTEVTEYQKRSAIPSKPKTGLYVEGLFLDGAQWDFAEKCLQTLTGDTSIYPLPIIGLFTSPARGLPIQGCLKLPVYATPKRKKSENGKVITELNIPTKKHESFWILENVYIVMNAEFSSK